MAKAAKREYVWLQCTESGDLNYRTQVATAAGGKLQLMKYNPKLRKHTLHKISKKK